MKVLIAEDEAISRRMLESLLPMWGYEVVTTSGGHAALDALRQEAAPRLAIIDWMMPDLDGIEVTRRVRSMRGLHYVYILLLTVKDTRSDLVDGLEAGADDYLAKPFDPNELRARLHAARRSLIAHDQLEQMTVELSRKNKKLGELTDTAHRFVDNVSHEFRTPLTVIKEFTSIISDGLGGPVTETQAEYLQMVTTAVHDLTQMVDDMLDSSKLKAGTLRVDRRPHHVAEVLAAARPLIMPKASMREVTVTEHVPDALPVVFADREKATRVLVNLVINAVKFSPQGGAVEITAEANGSEIVVSVHDNGPGLTAEDQRVIFERFRQVGGGGDGSTKGFGLGLNIAGELTWLNLGAMDVTSEPGKGSTFSFTIPVHEPPVIIEKYFQRLECMPTPAPSLALLRVEPAPGGDLEEVREFITSSCYPTDLVLTSPEHGVVWAIGTTDSANGWANRLLALREKEHAAAGHATATTFTVSCSGSWAFPLGLATARQDVEGQIVGGSRCAA